MCKHRFHLTNGHDPIGDEASVTEINKRPFVFFFSMNTFWFHQNVAGVEGAECEVDGNVGDRERYQQNDSGGKRALETQRS